ncbi:MAG TPA: Gfo/Idh/MocA family oxidoreductase [Chloroflexia bacterium]|nr:Gfo/Idh/MocA family oxidoreductase [Chloroflexia bacterium]
MKIGLMSFAHHHAESYARQLAAMPDVEVLGLADDDAERAQQYAQQLGLRLYPSYEALLWARPDAVIICSENSRHRPLVELAAAAGAHVLCEKPLATTLEDGQAILTACSQHGVKLMTAFPMRFSAPIMEIKASLAAGDLGQVYCCNATNQGTVPRNYRAWFVDPQLAGGGAVMDHTVHVVDILRWYLGSEVVEVYAQTNRIIQGEQVAVETGGLLMVTFANGVFATIDCSWSKPVGFPTWGGLTMELITDRGAVGVDAFRQNLTVYSAERGRPIWDHWGSDADGRMLADFIAAIREDRNPGVTGIDGYRALEVALAAYTSAAQGQPVRLPTG